jgi:Domain of unknown function (DUF1906)/PKD domain
VTSGADYSFNPHPPLAALKAAGVRFVGRYASAYAPNDSNGKNLLPGECHDILAASLSIILFEEEADAGRMLGGYSAGVTDAQHADAVVKALGMPGMPVYFCADFDATPQQQAPINSYLDGAASVIGRNRVGIYGGYYVVKRALDANKAHYACQTVAWSGGQWDARLNIRQLLQKKIGDVWVDPDTALTADYGQWPRPATGEPPTVKVTLGTTSGQAPLLVTADFTGTVAGTGTITDVKIGWGDGSGWWHGDTNHRLHTYQSPGSYEVDVIVTNSAGLTAAVQAGPVTVTAPPLLTGRYVTNGKLSLAEIAVAAGHGITGIATILQTTATHDGVFDQVIAGYLDDLASGAKDHTVPVPPGGNLWME